MVKSHLVLGVAGCLAAVLLSSPCRAECEALYQEALRELSVMNDSIYSHKTNVVEEEGIFDFDCSGKQIRPSPHKK